MEKIVPVLIEPIFLSENRNSKTDSAMLRAPTDKMYGKAFNGMKKLMPTKTDAISNNEPPMKHFKPVTKRMSLFLLSSLLRLLSIPQNKHALTMSTFPVTVSVRLSCPRFPLVVRNITPTKSMKIPAYSPFEQRSFRNERAINTVNNDSALRRSDALVAVVMFKPFSNKRGAITEPQAMTTESVSRSFLVILASVSEVPNIDRIRLHTGERCSANRTTPPTKYIRPAAIVGLTFSKAILFSVELMPNKTEERTALT